MANGVPLSTLLSQALFAFTVEVDNEFEREVAAAGAAPGFLVSLVMWSNFMRFVDRDGVAVRELSQRAGVAKGAVHPSLAGMQRWGYVIVARNPADTRPKAPRADWIVRPAGRGRVARETWSPLPGLIEARWRARFGRDQVEQIRAALAASAVQIDREYPRYLPVLGPGLHPAHFDAAALPPRDVDRTPALDLPALLSQVLLDLALDFERESRLSLAMSANVLRVLDRNGVRARDLPIRAGISKEAVSMSVGFLERRGYVAVEPDPTAARTKLVCLTPKGRVARDASSRLLAAVEERARARFGDRNVDSLRDALEAVVGAGDRTSPLFAGLAPYPSGWRAKVPRPEVLPHYPMVLHRGGWPDGS